MISRRTARVIGEMYQARFARTTHWTSDGDYGYGLYSRSRKRSETFSDTILYKHSLYDFLYDNDYPSWLLNQTGKLVANPRSIKEWVMRLHTGETQSSSTSNWGWKQRRQLGQQYLENLAEDILVYVQDTDDSQEKYAETLKSSLELDGYVFTGNLLVRSESDVLDVQEESGVLDHLYTELALENRETAFHHLKLSEEHYLAKRWDDCISNSRKFLECVMQEAAAKHNLEVHGVELSEHIYTRPVNIRDYLAREGLLEAKEKEAISKVYGLLSHAGSHPYMARNDQARLLRHLALTLSQFVLLRFQGSLSNAASAST